MVGMVVSVGIVWVIFIVGKFDILVLGERVVGYLGVNVNWLWLLLIVLIVLLILVVVVYVGVIIFVGFIVLYVLRLFIGLVNKWFILFVLLGGCLLVILFDIVV